SFEYLCLWYHCFAEPDNIRIIKVVNKNTLIGLFPLVSTSEFGKKVLRNLTNNHSLHFPALSRPEDRPTLVSSTIEILQEDQSYWDILRFDWMHSYLGQNCLTQADELSQLSLRSDGNSQPNFTINLDGTFDEFFSGLGSKLRKNLKMYRNKLAKEGESGFVHLVGREAIERFPEFVEIEGSGWKGKAGSSIAQTAENYHRYYRGLIQILADRNDLHLFFLELNKKSIAGVLGYTEGELFHYSKIGYCEDFGHLSPSNLLLLDIIREIKENLPQVKRFHLFPDGAGYKHRWVNEQSETFATTLFSNSIRGRTSYIGMCVRKRLREISWLKRVVQNMRSMGKG
ncbi:MAG: GNAT family N-acetyltransferase, partial [bacterium]|nr:GNAT family N-acetyltransferase [bacterium]